MAQLTTTPTITPEGGLPPLEAGDHLDQKTFHARYQAMPENFRAELIGGVVIVPSPLKYRHGRHHALIVAWLGDYEMATPGVEALDGATVILGDESEPQPDAILIVDPRAGGQVRLDENDYVTGPPELIVEIASSSEAYDLFEKKRDYEQAGVQEYVVVVVRSKTIRWFAKQGDRFVELERQNGVYRSIFFRDSGSTPRHCWPKTPRAFAARSQRAWRRTTMKSSLETYSSNSRNNVKSRTPAPIVHRIHIDFFNVGCRRITAMERLSCQHE